VGVSENHGGWTVHLVRQDGIETHTIRFKRSTWIWSAIALTIVLLVAGVILGRVWGSRMESAETRRLEAAVAELTGRQAQVAELTARLERIESDYLRMRRALGADAQGRAGGVVLPAPPSPAARGVPTDPGTSAPAWPLAQGGFLTRTFGSHTELSRSGHTGIDIAVPLGSYVRATLGGMVEESGRDSVYGFYLRIAHGDGISSLYGHNSWLFAAVGDSVERLQVVALSGNTGQSTAPHLHFEVERDGELLDPLNYVADGGTGDGGARGRNGVEPR
jgi:murein DD-endopeptidase MepM/ murein hydrolase activator NlpD